MSHLGRKIIFKQAAFLPIDPHGAAPPVNFFLLKKGWCRPQLSSWVQCQLRLCQWCPVETYCRHTGACIGFGRTFWNEGFRYIIAAPYIIATPRREGTRNTIQIHLNSTNIIVEYYQVGAVRVPGTRYPVPVTHGVLVILVDHEHAHTHREREREREHKNIHFNLVPRTLCVYAVHSKCRFHTM